MSVPAAPPGRSVAHRIVSRVLLFPRGRRFGRGAASQGHRCDCPCDLEGMLGGVDQDVSIVDQVDPFVNRCWRICLDKQSHYLPLLPEVLGHLMRAMRRCPVGYSAARGRCGPSSSLEGLPWDEFVRRVAAAEADAERAAFVRAHRSFLRLPGVIRTPWRTNSSGRADKSNGGTDR